MSRSIEIFISYSHRDETIQQELEKHLSLLRLQGFITQWTDRKISPGQEWSHEIDVHINTAHIILLLVSADFMNSSYCYGTEMMSAMERHERGEARVIPILLRKTDWQKAPFGKLQALPANGTPVKSWPDQDEAFYDVVENIRKIVEEQHDALLCASLNTRKEETFQPTKNTFPKAGFSCPYKGLSAFREEDEPFFFGREIFVRHLKNRVQKKPLIAVIGPSGSGKSSLVFAGLMPHLCREKNWCIVSFRPRDRPFRALATALIPLLETQMSEADLLLQIEKLAEPFRLGKLSLYDVIERILQKHGVDRLLLYIDQFEELYTLCQDLEDRKLFLDILLGAIQAASQQKTLNFSLVLTLRADFVGQVLLYRPFADALQDADLKLSSMNRQELEDTIKKPAERLNVKIEDGLTERILDAVSQEPGNLPLLEFTLTQMWDRQQSGTLVHSAYDKIGGVEQSIATYAENIYIGLDEEEQQQARRIFVQLVNPGRGTEDTRRIATRIQVGEKDWSLVVYLSDARLVVSGQDEITGEETVEIVHEALIRNWDRLHRWIEEDREFRLWQERLRTRMKEWERADCSDSELLRGVTLVESEKWLIEREAVLNQAEREFIKLSREQQQREKHLMQQLQQISNVFPFSKFTEDVYQFITSVVNVSSMLLTIYDGDTKAIYDVFAIDNGQRVEGLLEHPVVAKLSDRPVWWRYLTQNGQQKLELAPSSIEPRDPSIDDYSELLKGTWGDQSKAGSFLLLPMKTFNTIIGSLSIASTRSQAYHPEKIVMLETMVQIISVAIENAKLYERPRLALKQSKRREEALAVTISALQGISTVLNVKELLYTFVETVGSLMQAEMCSFFQLAPEEDELIAKAIFDRTGRWNAYDRPFSNGRNDHDELIQMIRLPFTGSLLKDMVAEPFFYLDEVTIEAIVQSSGESGAIFLREMRSQEMLIIPVRRYQSDVVGILAIHMFQQRKFWPEEISVLMAMSAQAANAIRNAQLFELIQEANAELQRVDKIKDEFVVTASHELRTPLSAISGYSALLRKQSESRQVNPDQVLKYATKIMSSARQLNELVDNMTKAARLVGLEKLEMDMAPVQLLAVVQASTTMLNINLEQPIDVAIAPNLWVSGDSLHLRQVITNLLDNAIKYSPLHVHIEIRARLMQLSQIRKDQVNLAILASGDDPEVVRIDVCDQGEGVTSEDAEKIFEKLVRSSRSLTTPVRGTGLGLYIGRSFIEAMGGRLWLDHSAPGLGSVFSFYLLRVPQPAGSRELEGVKLEAD